MTNKKQIEITKEDLICIHGNDYQLFEEKIIPNCYCAKCNSHYQSTIVNYKIFLNDLNDVILRGFCGKCSNPINRYLETSEVEKYQERIEKVRKKYQTN